jgi:uncharacterized protein involved in exopolysaccharide biosynthesis
MQSTSDGYEQILLIDVWRAISRRRWSFLLAVVTVQAMALAVAFLLTPYYRAEALIAPVVENQSGSALSSMVGQLGGLASLVSMPVASNSRAEALAILKSRALARQFILENELVPVLFEEQWDATANAWSSEVSEDPPSVTDAVNFFNRNVRKVIEDPKTGMVSVRIEWKDRLQAADWANALVDSVNQAMRERTIAEAQESIQYLKDEAQRTSIVELEQAIYQLVQEQVSTIMLAHVRDEYAFQVIDPAVPAEAGDYAGPNKLAIAALGLFGGIMAGIFLVLLRERATAR